MIFFLKHNFYPSLYYKTLLIAVQIFNDKDLRIMAIVNTDGHIYIVMKLFNHFSWIFKTISSGCTSASKFQKMCENGQFSDPDKNSYFL